MIRILRNYCTKGSGCERLRVAFINEDVIRRQFVVLLVRPSAERLELAVDGLFSALPVGGHSGIDRGTHRSPPRHGTPGPGPGNTLRSGFGTPDGDAGVRRAPARSPTGSSTSRPRFHASASTWLGPPSSRRMREVDRTGHTNSLTRPGTRGRAN